MRAFVPRPCAATFEGEPVDVASTVAAICLCFPVPAQAGCVASGGLGLAALAEPLLDDAEARMGTAFIVGLIVFAAATAA